MRIVHLTGETRELELLLKKVEKGNGSGFDKNNQP